MLLTGLTPSAARIDDQLSALTDVAAPAATPTRARPAAGQARIVDDTMAARQTLTAIESVDEIPAPDGSAYR
ncbi:hypothetical protein MYCOZU1_00399 [Mycobacterium intracellulare subsp. chimaera]|nr:hypothetical protein MYCOZU1_00399 [Mycobacterium intracellulare subsp. chimaera]ETZ38584.1 hypothetical protein L842_5952 [Mycobacterium intracellulare MIN_052511_1280]